MTDRPPSRRAERRNARKKQMLDAAMSIVLQDGVEALTIARIAKRLDAAVGALYRYFPGKEALLTGLQLRAIEELHVDIATSMAEADAALPPATDPGPRALAVILTGFATYLRDANRESPRHQLVDRSLSFPAPVLGDEEALLVDQAVNPLLDTIGVRIDGAVELGVIEAGSSRLRTHCAWTVVHGLDHFRKRDRIVDVELQTPTLFRALFSALLRDWGATPSDVDAAFGLFERLNAAR